MRIGPTLLSTSPPTRSASGAPPAKSPTAVDQVEVAQTEPAVRPWSNIQKPATRLDTLKDGALSVDAVRWGFNEEGLPTEWTGNFSPTTIDPRHVKNVYLGVKPFNPELLAAHSVLIFEMDDDHPIANAEGQKDTGLVLSMEARLHQGEQYKMVKTLNGKYPTVYQLGTWTDLVQKTTRREDHRLIRYRLDLDDQQKEQLIRNTLEVACADRSTDRYNLFTNSCHSVVIDLLNTVVPKGQQIHRWVLPHIANPMTVLPPYGDILFAGHNLLVHEQRLIIQPDQTLHPGTEKKPTVIGKTIETLSSHPAWKPVSALTGALAGSGAGFALNAALPCLPLQATVPLAAAAGTFLGLSLGETLKRRSHTDYQPSQKYFAEQSTTKAP